MSVFDRFVGLPYAEGGTSRAGADCHGLVVIVFGETRGVALPPAPDPAAWHEVERGAERPFDVVLIHERPWHVGLVVGAGRMLHMPARQTSCIEPYTTNRYAHRVSGFFRHEALA